MEEVTVTVVPKMARWRGSYIIQKEEDRSYRGCSQALQEEFFIHFILHR